MRFQVSLRTLLLVQGALALLMCWSSYVAWGLDFSGKREDPFLGGTLQWHGGEVRWYDYCKFPGSYDWWVEWHGPNGEKIDLADCGDDDVFTLDRTERGLLISYVVSWSEVDGRRIATRRTLLYRSPREVVEDSTR